MITNAHRPTREELLDIFRHDEQGDEECEALSAEAHKALLQRDETLHELEKLQASELIHRARNIDTYLKRMDNNERRAFGNAARRVAAELYEAARKSDRFIPDELPDYYRKQIG